MVRDLRAVFASMEKKFRMHPDIDDGMLDNGKLANITTHQRVESSGSSSSNVYRIRGVYRFGLISISLHIKI